MGAPRRVALRWCRGSSSATWHRRSSCRFSWVIGLDLRMMRLDGVATWRREVLDRQVVRRARGIDDPLGNVHLGDCLALAELSAAAPAALPSWLASFQTSTYCLPAATFCRLAVSPSWPLIGTMPYDLLLEGRDDAERGAVVLGQDRVDLGVVLDGGVDDRFHVVLGLGGVPGVRELVGQDLDACRHRRGLEAGLDPSPRAGTSWRWRHPGRP